MARQKGKSKIEKLEKKLQEIREGKWIETTERVAYLKSELRRLKGES